MTDEKLIELFSKYKQTKPPKQYDNYDDTDRCYSNFFFPSLQHITWMCDQAICFVQHGKREKAMRWLDFIQGVIWTHGLRSLNELRDDSRSDNNDND